MIIAGIDPGLGGAVAVINDAGECVTIPMPTMGEKTKRLVDGGALARFFSDNDVEFAIVELVAAFPGQGVSSMFRFGTAFGVVLGVLHAALIPHKFVTPAKWKKEMALSPDKSLSRRRAIERFPRSAQQFERAKDEGRAEAAMLALWYLERGKKLEAA